MNKVVEDLKKYGSVQRALLGIAGMDVSTYIDMEKEKGKEVDLGTVNGIYVSEVSADGSCFRSRTEREGDVITAIDNKRLVNLANFRNSWLIIVRAIKLR